MRRERTRPRRGAYGWSRVAVAHGSANPADGTGWPHNRRSSGTIAHLALLEFQELATPASSRFMRSRMSAASYYVGSSRPVTSRNRCAESRHHRRSKARTRRRSRRRALTPVVLLIADAPCPLGGPMAQRRLAALLLDASAPSTGTRCRALQLEDLCPWLTRHNRAPNNTSSAHRRAHIGTYGALNRSDAGDQPSLGSGSRLMRS
jgi:hypothetical protein